MPSSRSGDDALPHHSHESGELIQLMRNGKPPPQLPMPEVVTRFDGTTASWSTTPLTPMPNNIQRGSSRSRTRDVRIATGTGGTGMLMMAPSLAPYSDADGLIVSTGSFVATYWPDVGADTGMSQIPIDPQAPYKAADGDTYAWTGYAKITMRVNSSSVTNKPGRIYVGLNVDELQAGGIANFNGANFEQLPTFRSWGVAQLSDRDMPEVLWVPLGLSRKLDQVPTVTSINEPSICVWCEGFGSTSTVLEFSMSYTSVVAGINTPWDKPLHINTDGILKVANALARTAPKGFSHIESQEPKHRQAHIKEVQATEVRKQPLLSRIVDVGKTIAQKTGLGPLVKKALGWIPSLF